MDAIHFLESLYKPFFDQNNWQHVLTNSDDFWTIMSLVLMEILMSFDNALILAAQSKQLPDKEEQKKALFYGMWGSYIFRFLIIGIGTYLINFWPIKVLGAVYLVLLSVSHFYKQKHGNISIFKSKRKKKQLTGKKRFWSVVISIEFIDIAFSVDAVLAALAISDNPVVILIGSIIGILAMRIMASYISKIMDVIPELENTAYFLIILIAIKLFLSIPQINIHLPNWIFFLIIVLAVIATFIVHKYNETKTQK